MDSLLPDSLALKELSVLFGNEVFFEELLLVWRKFVDHYLHYLLGWEEIGARVDREIVRILGPRGKIVKSDRCSID